MKYQNSPVIERIISCDIKNIPEKQYQKLLILFERSFEDEFPHMFHEKKSHWNIQIKNELGMLPEISAEDSKLSIFHRYWSSTPQNNKHPDWCIQIRPDKFIFNLRQYHKNPKKRSFPDLLQFFNKWFAEIKKLISDFTIINLNLEYFNRLDYKIFADNQFIKSDFIDVENLLTYLKNTPKPPYCEKYIVPFYNEMSWNAKYNNEKYFLTTKIHSQTEPLLGLNVHFFINKRVDDKNNLSEKLENMHSLINDLFNSTFTEQAKQIFRGEIK